MTNDDGNLKVAETRQEAVALLRPYIGDEAADLLLRHYDRRRWDVRAARSTLWISPDSLYESVRPREYCDDVRCADVLEEQRIRKVLRCRRGYGDNLPSTWMDPEEWRLHNV